MTHLRKLTYRVAVITSLLLAIAMSYGWWWGHGRMASARYTAARSPMGQSAWQGVVMNGQLIVQKSRDPCADEPGLTTYVHEHWSEGPYIWFHMERSPGYDCVVFGIPFWFIILLALLLPGHWLIRHRRKLARARVGCCAKCGYDLRGRGQSTGSTACPECGASVETR